MGFDLQDLRAAVAGHGRVARVVIAAIRGSSPREVGAAMLVWKTGQSGTIGGGTLEFEAAQAARSASRHGLSHHALGPDLGQCCGGAVTLLTETYDAETVAVLDPEVIARPVSGPADMPMAIRRVLATARSQGVTPAPQLVDGWMIEPVHQPARPLWIWGAGHVGRALVQVLAPMPDLAITWVDTAPNRFPGDVPSNVTAVPAAKPAELVRHAPAHAEHLILTYSHTLDLDLCHRLLGHDFAFAGLIGSKTKWARFRSRLGALDHPPDRIADITCPIGDPTLGKHPQMIAVGVAAALMQPARATLTKKDLRA
ncbi:xanthine dehydrogenase accessory protein XdhC [Sedimentitalea todarodis]|uniref:Xanthine dehydrogenase accessory protein XdhC n=1 Tax=Sedimentitalea todarodis TaxID=1631240 RepID=A0ABU3VFK5_9RHOB|nr:xanthine dehydrogenase accessory protein XdhC [Sedimentitalea todarodis]MDU9004953.1 xanthine dehydrogenase accessory protein XdhC [Sedimentitalea todarodis]